MVDDATLIHPTNACQSVGIAGAGLLGRLLAYHLSYSGHSVTVFDPASSAQPADAHRNAGFTAAGMLSPIAELDNAAPVVAALGWRSIALWQELVNALPCEATAPMLSVQGSIMLAHRSDAGTAQRILSRIQHAYQSPDWQRTAPAQTDIQVIDKAQLQELEPNLQGHAQAWLLPQEGMIDTVAMMQALYDHAHGVQWQWGQSVTALRTDGSVVLADGSEQQFDVVIDARGVGAKQLDADLPTVRGVRGETIWLELKNHGLMRPVRLLHPRHRVYMVPRNADTIIVGASEIESEDYSPVSLRSAVELMAAGHSVMPELAEARIVKMESNCRPATPDNNPIAQWDGKRLTINGLFRHGWLLAPALVEQALNHARCPLNHVKQ